MVAITYVVTSNGDKVDAVGDALKGLGLGGDDKVVMESQGSGVKNMPVGLGTLQGAITRVDNALAALKERRELNPGDTVIAVESGLGHHPRGAIHEDKKCGLPCHAIAYVVAERDGRRHMLEVDEGFDLDVPTVRASAGSGFNVTTGQVLEREGTINNHADPHLYYLGRSRRSVLAESIEVALARLAAQFDEGSKHPRQHFTTYTIAAASPACSAAVQAPAY